MAAKKNILVVSTDFGTEHDELTVPVAELKKLGHTVTVATPDKKPVQTVEGDKDWSEVVAADLAIADATDAYDVVVIPGGTVNADNARMDADVRRLVKAQAEGGRTVAAICHGPWTLIDADVARGKTMTSYQSIRIDLENAGATWKDDEAFVCGANGWTLITSRNPGDLDAFVKAIDAA